MCCSVTISKLNATNSRVSLYPLYEISWSYFPQDCPDLSNRYFFPYIIFFLSLILLINGEKLKVHLKRLEDINE